MFDEESAMQLTHIYREANNIVDYLAHVIVKSSNYHIYKNDDLPSIINGMIRLDKCVLSFVRLF